MQHKSCKVIRTIAARFDTGDDLLLSLQRLAEENNIRSGYFSAIGALKKIAYGLFERGQHRNLTKEAKNCFEMMPLAGNITIKEGKVMAHAHICATDDDGAVFGGHLMEGTIIYPFVEVFMQEIDIEIGRALDPKINLWVMKF